MRTKLATALLLIGLLVPKVGTAQRAYLTQQLDVNGQCIGNGTEELLCFTETGSAINEWTMVNDAAGSPATVQLQATGGSTNINANIVAKGSGNVQANGVDVVTLSGTQTLTNKTLTTPNISGTGFANATHLHTAASSGGQITQASISDLVHLATSITDNIVDFPDIVYTNTLAGNPGFLVDECYLIATAGGGGFICEGSSADTQEMLFLFPDLNEADTTHRIVTESATQTLTSKTLTTPTIVAGGMTNMQHTHLGATTGGQITEGSISDLDHTDVDAIHDNVNSEISAIAAKATPTTSDFLLIEDAAASNAKKRITIGDLPGGTTTTEIEVNLDEMFLLIPQTGGPTASLVGSNFLQEALAFSDSTDNEVYIRFPIDHGYTDSAIVCDWIWETTTTTGEACFCMDAADAPTGAGRDPADEVAASCTSSTAGGTASFLVETSITLTGTFAGGNMFLARLFRDPDESETGCGAGDDDLGDVARLLTGSCKYDVTL